MTMNDGGLVPPGGGSERSSRFAELASELLGTKMVAELIRETWASASPDVKRELSDAILKQIKQRIDSGNNDWEVRGAIESAARKEFSKIIEERREDFEDNVRKRTATMLTTMMDRVADELARALSDSVLGKLKDAALEALRRPERNR